MGPDASSAEIIKANLEFVRARTRDSCIRSGRSIEQVTLIAVTKGKPLEIVRKAYALGLREFGENRVQEAAEKIGTSTALQEMPELRVHMVGHLQSNKVRKLATFCASVDSVDSIELATKLNMVVKETGRTMRVLVEVNSSGESQKFGVLLSEAKALVEQLLHFSNLHVAGLMTVGPNTPDPFVVRESFQRVRTQFEQIKQYLDPPHWSVISMGMSGDYQIAIEEGATEIRLGTALFGVRN